MSELFVDTVKTQDGTKSISTTNVVDSYSGSAKAWFSAVTWATPDNSLNVSSISDDGAGQSTVSWSNNFADDTYTIAGASPDADGHIVFTTSKSASSCPTRHYGGLVSGAGYIDFEVTVVYHGDLA